MKITDIIAKKDLTLSFEVFPPKNGTDGEAIVAAAEEIADFHPDFMSVTYGAGGSSSKHTAKIAATLTEKHGVPTVAHLTCVGSKQEDIRRSLDELSDLGVENILALRGDMPQDGTKPEGDFRHASELIEFIRSEKSGFCIGGACYPQGHVESLSASDDLKKLKIKTESGCDFLTSQMFFDNDIFYRFMYKVRDIGIKTPVFAGIMPVTNAAQMKRICALSGTTLPQRFVAILDKFGSRPDAMAQAGIAYATEQIIDLYANGVNGVHIYSMNKPWIARAIKNNLSDILS